ncbi:MAG TPA: S41 family peptidase [Bryobacteraceae bacterium]|nr:S41 family peptidase [Bryobacteraceae bacterium]
MFILAAATCAPSLLAQVTPEQRLQDFQLLVNLYSRRYAPAEWKNQALRFDLSNTTRWLERVRRAKDDIEYHEIALEYVAMLEDTHSSYTAPGSASASLGFSVDIYDGKVLIESVDRSRLPVADYPFAMGDELVSVDGRTAEEWIEHLARFRRFGNPRTTRRMAADRITFRSQSTYPRIRELGDTASVIIRRASGELGTYTLEWKKSNIPYSGSPSLPKSPTRQSRAEQGYMDVLQGMWNWSTPTTDTVFQGETVDEDGNFVPRRYVLGYGAKQPTFTLPPDFVMRLGKTPADFHVSGTYEADGLRIGYLRLPTFSPPNLASAIQELDKEIQYLNENTDGLVLDISRNTGGGCYMLDVARRLMRDEFWFFGEEIRPTWDRIQILQAGLESARQQKAEDWVITMLSHNVDKLLASYQSGSHRTEALPSCYFQGMAPAWMNKPVQNPYSKPLIVLVDEFSTSAGDIFAAMMQDNNRGPLVGMRTNGAGGAVSHPLLAGPLTEAMVSNTNTLVVRKDYVANAPDLPVNRYIENTGVRPEIVIERMTRENLMNGGKPFVDAFTRAMIDHIRSSAN